LFRIERNPCRLPRSAERPVPYSHRNGRIGPHCGPSRGESCRRALRPLRAQAVPSERGRLFVDVGCMRDALSSDTVTKRVPSIESRGPARSHASNLSNGLTSRRYRLTTIWAIPGIEAVPSRLFARSVHSGRAGIKPFCGRLRINSCGNLACLKPSCALTTLHPC
jgi:hypothetical protein